MSTPRLPSPRCCPCRPPGAPGVRRREAQRGFSLIELMISLAIGLLIMAAASSVYVTSSRSSKVSAVSTQLNEDGLLALNILAQQIKQAGYSQRVSNKEKGSKYVGAAVRGCLAGFASGQSGADFFAANGTLCKVPDADEKKNSDSLIVRYEADLGNTIPVKDGGVDYASNCVGQAIGKLQNSDAAVDIAVVAANSASPAAAATRYALADNRYYLDGTALKCVGHQGKTAISFGRATTLIENVEQIVLRYGVTAKASLESPQKAYAADENQVIAYLSAQGVNALVTGDTQGAINDRWGRVRSINVCLLMRSSTMLKDASNVGRYRDCRNAEQTNNDGYLRRSFTTTIALRNRLPIPACRIPAGNSGIGVPDAC